MMLKCSAGSEQNFLGETRRELAEEFLNFIEAGRRKKLEEEISSLHIIKDEGRFRIQLLLMLFEAFFSGATYGRDDLRLKEAPEQK